MLVQYVNNAATPYTYGNRHRTTKASAPFDFDYLGNVTPGPANTAAPTTYSPYGEPQSATITSTFGYRAEYTTSNLLYLRARNYDPTTGTLTTRDPLDGVNGSADVTNAYTYVHNTPLNGTDPTGQRCTDDYCFTTGTPDPISTWVDSPMGIPRQASNGPDSHFAAQPVCNGFKDAGRNAFFQIIRTGFGTRRSGNNYIQYSVSYRPHEFNQGKMDYGIMKQWSYTLAALVIRVLTGRPLKMQKLNEVDTRNHPRPSGTPSVHSNVYVEPGDFLDVYAQIKWYPRTVDYFDDFWNEGWLDKSEIEINCQAR